MNSLISMSPYITIPVLYFKVNQFTQIYCCDLAEKVGSHLGNPLPRACYEIFLMLIYNWLPLFLGKIQATVQEMTDTNEAATEWNN